MLLLNGQPVPVTIFPDKTSQVWKLPESIFYDSDEPIQRHVYVEWKFEHEGEFMHLAQLKALIAEYGLLASLRIKYLPYGRQDKGVNNKTTFALYPFAELLNILDFQQVEIVDPHSEHATDWIENSVAIQSTMISELWNTGNYDLVCYPDKGALSKYSKLYDYLHIYGEKIRDQLTGNILSYKVVGDCAGKNVLIVDDICDGGATFKFLAKDLLAAGAKSVVLFVTHGIFSKGLQILKDSGIQRIFTQDGEAFEDAGQIIYRRL